MDLAQHLQGIPTGFEMLDLHAGGLLPGALWVVLATPGTGRTIFATHLALRSALRAGVETVLHLGRESDQVVMLNIYSQMTQVCVQDLQRNRLDDDARQRLATARNKLEQVPLTIAQPSRPSVAGKPVDYELSLARGRVTLVDDFDDYFWLYQRSENSLLIDKMRWLRSCSLTSTLILTLPEERWLDGRVVDPGLRREADVIVRLVRPDLFDRDERPGELELHLLHNRTGPTGVQVTSLVARHRRIMTMNEWWSEGESTSAANEEASPGG